jgi:hypothetical protein
MDSCYVIKKVRVANATDGPPLACPLANSTCLLLVDTTSRVGVVRGLPRQDGGKNKSMLKLRSNLNFHCRGGQIGMLIDALTRTFT